MQHDMESSVPYEELQSSFSELEPYDVPVTPHAGDADLLDESRGTATPASPGSSSGARLSRLKKRVSLVDRVVDPRLRRLMSEGWQYGAERLGEVGSIVAPGSIKGSVFVLLTATVGAGVLSLPSAMERTGWGLGAAIIVAGGLLAFFSLHLLVLCSEYCDGRSYQELAYCASGPRLRWCTTQLLLLNLFGSTVAYIIACGDLFAQSAHDLLQFDVDKGIVMIVITCVFVVPLSLAKKMDALRFSSLLALMCSLFLTVATVMEYFDLCRNPAPQEGFAITGGFCIWSNATVAADVARAAVVIDGTRIADLFYAIPIVVYAFTSHPNVLPIYLELQRPSKRRIHKVLRRTLLVAVFLYVTTSLAAFMTFIPAGDYVPLDKSPKPAKAHTAAAGATRPFAAAVTKAGEAVQQKRWRIPGNYLVAQGYSQSSVMHVATLLMGVTVTLALPLIVHAFRYYALHALSGTTDVGIFLHAGITLGVLAISLFVGCVCGDISLVLSLLGATTNPLICYILPGIFFLNIAPKRFRAKKLLAVGMMMTMVVCSLWSLFFTFRDSLGVQF